MPFTNFSDQGSTLTADERAQEAIRILRRIASDDRSALTERAQEFVDQMLGDLESFGTVGCSVSQLYWLREINERVN